MEIEVGSYYQIDHSSLPRRSPVQLQSVRVVMVAEKTDRTVTIKFPSGDSISKYLYSRSRESPALDEKFIMGLFLTHKVLQRRISSLEFDNEKREERFWLVAGKMTSCLSHLNSSNMMRWGIRRRVAFLEKNPQNENNCSQISNTLSISLSTQNENQQDNDEDEDDDNDNGKQEDETPKKKLRRSSRVRNPKRRKRGQIVHDNTTLKDGKDRWSAERYNLAETTLFKVIEEKGAVFGKTILRPELKAEVRKFIGDTGLLDHLLKHVAGKVSPDGLNRIRRRHNPEGVMEYWLESADLDDIRKQAGVQDSYWIPPPGWVLGDSATEDTVSVKEFRELKEEVARINRSHLKILN
ncbi:hypothetical protein RJ641_008150 [Dillenia turbinata]|uniref:PTC1-like winged helix-turn-helix domain-containing protein n=1 Tax=Dillenia turbinata TaxID=194707 RepID=A0AAN8Z685_9MAGN